MVGLGEGPEQAVAQEDPAWLDLVCGCLQSIQVWAVAWKTKPAQHSHPIMTLHPKQ